MIRLTAKGRHWLSAGAFLIALTAAAWRAPAPPAQMIALDPEAGPQKLAGTVSRGQLPKVAEFSHSPSLAQLADGRIVAAWVAANHEDADDTAIWISLRGKQGWSEAKPVANRESTAGGTFAHISKVANPILYVEGSWLHLWYDSSSLLNGSGASIKHSLSTDAGHSWFKPTSLQTSPLSSSGTLLREPPYALADGGLALPLAVGQRKALLRISATAQILDKTSGAPEPISLQSASPAPDESRAIARLRLPGDRLLVAGNPQGDPATLMLWRSSDNGKTWAASRNVESAPDGAADFSQPALLRGRDGLIHLAYTWRRQNIKYLEFREAWLEGGSP